MILGAVKPVIWPKVAPLLTVVPRPLVKVPFDAL
jgi:hypothetical protein